jgi:hypothetical protein
MEMIAALVYKLTDGASCEEFKEAGWEGQYVQHDHGLFWTDANGVPWSAKYIACLGDPIADLAGNLYTLNTATLAVTAWKTNVDNLACVGLAATQENILSLWEDSSNGLLSVMDTAGEIVHEYRLPGVPTALAVDASGLAYVSLVGKDNQLGLAVIGKEAEDLQQAALKLTCPLCQGPLSGYPIDLALNDNTIYLITEEGSLTIIDKTAMQATKHTTLGQSLDAITLLPNDRQALGLSVMKGNLAMVDLAAGRITALTATSHYLGPVAVIAQHQRK